MREFFRQSFVLEQVGPTKAIRYVCYEDLRTGKFCVTTGEFLTVPQGSETLTFHAVQQAEHFIAEGVGRWFDSLLEAVEDFAVVMEDERNT